MYPDHHHLTSALASGALALRAGATGPSWEVPLLVQDDVELWLLAWAPGQATPTHGHGSASALTVLEGTLVEDLLDPTVWTTCRRQTHRAGGTAVFEPGRVHLLRNPGPGPALSVHARAARLRLSRV